MEPWQRANRDRWLLGVCGGIAHRYGWDPRLVQLATVLLAVAIPGPSLIPTVLVYVLLGALLPRSDTF